MSDIPVPKYLIARLLDCEPDEVTPAAVATLTWQQLRMTDGIGSVSLRNIREWMRAAGYEYSRTQGWQKSGNTIERLEARLESLLVEKSRQERMLANTREDIAEVRRELAEKRAQEKREKKTAQGPTPFQLQRRQAAISRREEVLLMKAQGHKLADIAELLGVSTSTARRLLESAERLQRIGVIFPPQDATNP